MVEQYFCNCMYFTANRLGHIANRIAEEEFLKTGLSPSYVFALMIINGREGIKQIELGKQPRLTPSTITRFVDKLENMGLARRKTDGKVKNVFPTEKGRSLDSEILRCRENLHNRYIAVLGETEAGELISRIDRASTMLEGNTGKPEEE